MHGKIPLFITVEQMEHSWFVKQCQIDLGEGLAPMPPSRRPFISSGAAVNFMKRTALRELQMRGRVAIGTDLDCHVSVCMSGRQPLT